MPKVKTKTVRYPEGWDLIEPYIDELEKEMRVGTQPAQCAVNFSGRARPGWGLNFPQPALTGSGSLFGSGARPQ